MQSCSDLSSPWAQMETHATKRARSHQHSTSSHTVQSEQPHSTAQAVTPKTPHQGGQQPVSYDVQPSTTQLLSLPLHLIASDILPQVSDPASVGAFLASCHVAHSLSSTRLLADWLLLQEEPQKALYLAADRDSPCTSEALLLALLESQACRTSLLEARR